jgi:pimeloyl-ACP methyl ester carboxylesterase
MAVMAPGRIAAAVLNDIGPEISDVGVERIKTYVGGGQRFKSWDEAGETIARNVQAFENYTHDDWVRMARRNCREDNGEIVFDYDMAIALPFNTPGPAPQFDMWPLFAALAQKPLLVIRGAKSDLLSAAAAEKMQSAAPNMKLALVPGVGHAPELNEPEASAAIDAFLAEIETPAS